MFGMLLQVDTRVFYFCNATLANRVFDVAMPFLTDFEHWLAPLAVLVVIQADLLCARVLKLKRDFRSLKGFGSLLLWGELRRSGICRRYSRYS